MLILKLLMSLYEKASSQTINFDKSIMVANKNCSSKVHESLNNYLGLMLVNSMNKSLFFVSLENRISAVSSKLE